MNRLIFATHSLPQTATLPCDYARKWLASGQPVKCWGINVDVNGKCVDEVLSERNR